MNMRKSIIRSLILTSAGAVALSATSALAQNYVKIENRQFGHLQINVEKGGLDASPALNGWWSADWVFEPLTAPDGRQAYRIKNRYTGVYLNTEVKPIQATNIQSGAWSSYWTLEPTDGGFHRVKNYYTNTYLNAETQKLDANTNSGSLGAQWKLVGLNGPEPLAQCVKNVFGTGIVAKVKWYDPAKVTYSPAEATNNVNTERDDRIPQLKFGEDNRTVPVKEETISLGQQSCFTGSRPATAPHFAIVSVEGGKFAAGAVQVALTTAVAVAVAGAAACVATAGTTCPAVAGAVVGLASGTISMATLGIPNPIETFYVGVPGQLEIKGTVFNPVYNDVAAIDGRTSTARQRDATDAIKAAFVGEEVQKGERGIKFNNQAGYAASMSVMYFMMKNISGVSVPTPVFVGTEKITAGFVRTVIIPQDTVPGMPINVTITGVATVSNPAYTTTVDGAFTGERCFKSYGSLFNPNGGPC